MSVPLASLRRLVAAVCCVVVAAGSAGAQLLDVEPFTALDGTTDVHFADFTLAPGMDASVIVMTGRWTRDINKQDATVQRFAASGMPIGTLTRVDDGIDLVSTRIAADSRGGYVALWEHPSGIVLVGRLLDAAGSPASPSFTVASGVFLTDAAGYGDGTVIVWSDPTAVHLRRYDLAGNPRGPAEDVAATPAFSVVRLHVAATSAGGFVVAWNETDRARARVYDASGVPTGDAVELTDEFTLDAVAANPLGGFAIVGARRTDTHARPSGVWMRRFDAAGIASGPPDPVELVDPDVLVWPTAAFDPAGRLYVAWNTNAAKAAVRGRAYDPAGRPLHASFALENEATSGLMLTARADGRFVEAWRSIYDLRMQVRALCVPPTHTGCGDGVVEAPCERCDAGPNNSDTTPDACRTTCALPSCGDGVVDHGEACDDGNRRGCDGCDANCNLEVGWACGDGIVSADCDEGCDDGPGNDDTLPNACRTDCRRAHCGDGVLDDGEGCDDGNRTSCDGCSDRCVPEPGLVCGDGIPQLECGEQCDDGNAIDGDGCTAPCRLERIPGGGSPFTDCEAEWVVDNPTNVPLYDKSGAINGMQTCVDGDPRCDFDDVVGTCTFHVRVCGNNTDLPTCTPRGRLRSWELRSPSAAKVATRPALAPVRAAFATVPGAIVGPTATDVCSDTLAVPVAVRASGTRSKPGSLVLKSQTTLYTGEKDGDKLKLVCLP